MKTIKKRLRRAFTIVELVVVIAVIAALAAILIPTFVNVLNSANESVDTSLVKNLNTILASEEILHGEQASTMGEALEWVEDNGYSVEKITPTSSGYNIVWDSASNRFVLMDDEDNVVYYDESTTVLATNLWYITDSTTIIGGSKNYYYSNGVETTEGEVAVSSNVDLSGQEGITNVKVTVNETDITIAVSNTALEVENTGNASVNVYGTVTSISGTNYGDQSLHIFGMVIGKIELTEGRVVAESGSSISTIVVKATDAEKVAIVVKSSSTVTTIAATEDSFVNSLSSIVSGAGVNSSSISNVAVSNDFAGGVGTESNPYQIATVEDFEGLRNLIEEDKTAGVYFILTNDIDLGENWVPLGNANIEVTNPGTAKVDSRYSDIFYGVLEGNNKTITMGNSTAMADNYDFALFSFIGEGAVIRNLNVEINVTGFTNYSCGAIASIVSGYGGILFENITVDGVITASAHGGGLIGWYAMGCMFKNCTNKAAITSNGVSSKYSAIGGICAQAGAYMYNGIEVQGDTSKGTNSFVSVTADSSVSFIECANYGTLTHACTTAEYYSMIGNIVGQIASKTKLYADSYLTQNASNYSPEYTTPEDAPTDDEVKYCSLTFIDCVCAGTIYGVATGTTYYFEGYIYDGDTNSETTYTEYDSSNPQLLIGGPTPSIVIVMVNGKTTTYTTSDGGIGSFGTSSYATLEDSSNAE